MARKKKPGPRVLGPQHAVRAGTRLLFAAQLAGVKPHKLIAFLLGRKHLVSVDGTLSKEQAELILRHFPLKALEQAHTPMEQAHVPTEPAQRREQAARPGDQPTTQSQEPDQLRHAIATKLRQMERRACQNLPNSPVRHEVLAMCDSLERMIVRASPHDEESRLEIARLKHAVEAVSQGSTIQMSRRVCWRVLPGQHWRLPDLFAHYERLKQLRPGRRYDLSRLEKLATLNPSECYVGLDEFEGYVVFCFRGTETAVLENPLEGNAVYVIGSRWQPLSHLSKSELLEEMPDVVHRVVHQGDWFGRLVVELSRGQAPTPRHWGEGQ